MLQFVLAFCVGLGECTTPDYLFFPSLAECERQRIMLLADLEDVTIVTDCKPTEAE